MRPTPVAINRDNRLKQTKVTTNKSQTPKTIPLNQTSTSLTDPRLNKKQTMNNKNSDSTPKHRRPKRLEITSHLQCIYCPTLRDGNRLISQNSSEKQKESNQKQRPSLKRQQKTRKPIQTKRAMRKKRAAVQPRTTDG